MISNHVYVKRQPADSRLCSSSSKNKCIYRCTDIDENTTKQFDLAFRANAKLLNFTEKRQMKAKHGRVVVECS